MSSFTAALRGNLRIDESFRLGFVRVLLLPERSGAGAESFCLYASAQEQDFDSFRIHFDRCARRSKVESTGLLAVSMHHMQHYCAVG